MNTAGRSMVPLKQRGRFFVERSRNLLVFPRPVVLPRLDKFWTLANLLSILRAVLAVPICILILQEGDALLIAGLLVVAGATDWLDGKVARWTGTVTEWGKVLDPIADKVAVLAVGGALVIAGLLPLWLVAAVAVRDLLILSGGTLIRRSSGEIQTSMWIGKVAVTAMGITMLAAVLRADPPIMAFCLWATAALMVLSFLQYLVRFVRLRQGAA